MPPASNDESLFTVFGTSKVNAIQDLIKYCKNPGLIGVASADIGVVSADYERYKDLIELMLGYIDVVEMTTHERSKASFTKNVAIIVKNLQALADKETSSVSIEAGGIHLLKVLSLFYKTNLRVYRASVSANLIILHQITHDETYQTLDLLVTNPCADKTATDNLYLKLVKVKLKCGVLPAMELRWNRDLSWELSAEEYVTRSEPSYLAEQQPFSLFKYEDVFFKLAPQHDTSLYSYGTNLIFEKYYLNAASCNNRYAKLSSLLLKNPALSTTEWCELGKKYFLGQGVSKDEELAQACFEHAQAIPELLKLRYDSNLTATRWHKLGKSYEESAEKIPQNFSFARGCYELALRYDIKHFPSLFALGILHEHGLGGEVNLEKANDCYKEIDSLGNEIITLRLLHHTLTTEQQWLDMADKLQAGSDGVEPNLHDARLCYEIVLRINPHSTAALAALGNIHEEALGVDKNVKLAMDYYRRIDALLYSSDEAACNTLHRLVALEYPNNNDSAEEWHELGESYLVGRDSVRARVCFEKALAIDQNILIH